MSDVFISYAHEDQAFARKLADALQADGLSVWWDHTIPPGKTWHTFIARGIEQAKACVVVWSQTSIASKWVIEEASLAGDADKLLPVSIDNSPPPMGFRSMQAAQLKGWSGDRGNAQYRLLLQEARALASGTGAPASARPAAREASIPSPSRPPRALIGGIVGGAVVVALVLFVVTRQPAPTPTAETPVETAETASTDSASPPADVAASPTQPRSTETSAELERLRRERDDALEAARNQQAEVERLRTQPPAPSTQDASVDWILGSWRKLNGGCADYLLFQREGETLRVGWGAAARPAPTNTVSYDAAAATWADEGSVRWRRSGDQLLSVSGNCAFARGAD